MTRVEMKSLQDTNIMKIIASEKEFSSLDGKRQSRKPLDISELKKESNKPLSLAELKKDNKTWMTLSETRVAPEPVINSHLQPVWKSFQRARLIRNSMIQCFGCFHKADCDFCSEEFGSANVSSGSLLRPEEIKQFKRVMYSSPTIAVCGEVNTGKSSFINCLLGEEILPVDEALLTCQAIQLVKPTKEFPSGTVRVRKREKSGFETHDSCVLSHTEMIQDFLYDMLESSTESIIAGKGCKEQTFIQIDLSHPLLQENVKITEYPAIDGPKTYQNISEQLSRNPLTMVVYLIDVTDLVTRETEQFLNYLSSNHPQVPIFFLLTKVDAETEEVSRRDRKVVTTLPVPSPQGDYRDFKNVQKVFQRLNKIEVLTKANSQIYEAFNLSSVSLIDPTAFRNPDIVRMMMKLSSWISSTYWNLVTPTYYRLYITVHAITTATSFNKSQENICHDITQLLLRLKEENKNYRRSTVKKVKEIIEKGKPGIVKNLLECVATIKKPPRSKLNQKRGSLSALYIPIAEVSKIDLQEEYEKEMNHQIRKHTQKEVDVSLMSCPSLLDEMAEQRDTLMTKLRFKVKEINKKNSLKSASFMRTMNSIIHFYTSGLPQIGFNTKATALFGEETFFQKFSQMIATIRTAASTGLAALTTHSTPNALDEGRSDLNQLSEKNQNEIIENVFRRIRPERIVRDNYDAVDDTLDLLIKHVELFTQTQNSVFDSVTYFTSADNIAIFQSIELSLMALESSAEKGFWKCKVVPFQDLFNRPCLFNIYPQNGCAKLKNTRMFHQVNLKSMRDARHCLDLSVLQHFREVNSQHILSIFEVLLDSEKNLLLLAPPMDTDLFLILRGQGVYDEIIHFHQPKIRLKIFSQVVDACIYLAETFKQRISISLRPEHILMNNRSVKLYVGENCSPDKAYPDNSGPYAFISLTTKYSSFSVKHNQPNYRIQLNLQLALLLWWLCAQILCEPPNLTVIQQRGGMAQLTSHLSKEVRKKVLSKQKSADDVILVSLMRVILHEQDYDLVQIKELSDKTEGTLSPMSSSL